MLKFLTVIWHRLQSDSGVSDFFSSPVPTVCLSCSHTSVRVSNGCRTLCSLSRLYRRIVGCTSAFMYVCTYCECLCVCMRVHTYTQVCTRTHKDWRSALSDFLCSPPPCYSRQGLSLNPELVLLSKLAGQSAPVPSVSALQDQNHTVFYVDAAAIQTQVLFLV